MGRGALRAGVDPDRRTTFRPNIQKSFELKRHYDAYQALLKIRLMSSNLSSSGSSCFYRSDKQQLVEVDFDNRGRVAGANSMGGIWEIKVEKAGVYLVRLGCWASVDRSLSSFGPAGRLRDNRPWKGATDRVGQSKRDGNKPIAKPIATFIHRDAIELSEGDIHYKVGSMMPGARLSGAFYGRVIPQ